MITMPTRIAETSANAPYRLDDGRLIRLGLVTPADRPMIAEGMLRLSVTSSWRRFFTVRHRLTELLLRRLGLEASRRDVRRLSGIVMPENVPMLKLLERHARGLMRRVTSEHVAFEYPLPAAA